MTILRTTTGLVSAVLTATLLLACTADDPDEPSSAGGTPEAVSTATAAIAPPTVTSTPIPGLTPASGSTPATLVLDTAPRATPAVTQKTLAPFTPSTLPLPDARDTVLYDVAANTATNLGPGSIGQFSPDGKWMVYSTLAGNNPTEIYLVDLATKQKRALALGRDPLWRSKNQVVFLVGNDRMAIDVTTGQRSEIPEKPAFPDFSVTQIPGGTYQLRRVAEDAMGRPQHQQYAIEEVDSGKAILQFTGVNASPVGVDEVVVASPAVNGTTNIFTVAVKTGASKLVATVPSATTPWPLSGSANYLAWTASFCTADGGRTTVYDRKTGTFFALDRGFWLRLTPDGLIAPGEINGKSLVDPVSLRAIFAIPGVEDYAFGRDVSWSPDYKFASTGFVGGHGGACPP